MNAKELYEKTIERMASAGMSSHYLSDVEKLYKEYNKAYSGIEKQIEKIEQLKKELNIACNALWLLDETEEAQSALRQLGLWGTSVDREQSE